MKNISIYLCLICLLSVSAKANEASNFTNYLGMEFVTIPKGSFIMGVCKENAKHHEMNEKRKFLGQKNIPGNCPPSAKIETFDTDPTFFEEPAHKVKIKKSFQMGIRQVSLGTFKKFIINTKKEKIIDFWFRFSNKAGDKAPIVSISWQTAQDFITWMNNNKPTNDKGFYRLPTEAEWEYVARGNRKSIYNFFYYATMSPSASPNSMKDLQSWRKKEKFEKHNDMKPNSFGVYGFGNGKGSYMEDCYDGNGYENTPKDGSAMKAKTEKFCQSRVIRNTTISFNPMKARLTTRHSTTSTTNVGLFSFRVVRDILTHP